MKKWEDKGNGQWKLIVSSDTDPGVVLSVYYGTRDEILDKLVDSQIHANNRIGQLRRGSDLAPSQPKPLSPEERLQTVTELGNPATVDKAVTRVLESVVGPVNELREDRRESAAERQTRAAVEAAEAFAKRTPDWYPSEFNKRALVGFLQTQGLDPTKTENYTLAFERMSAAQLLQALPPESANPNDEPEAEGRNAPTPTQRPTPTRFSTSIRSSDISGTAPKPTVRLKYTREQIANMSATKYKSLMSDPEFVRCVEYFAQADARKRRAS